MEALLKDLQGLAPAIYATKVLLAGTVLPVLKATVLMLQLASIAVKPPLILLMMGLLKIKETSTA